MKENKNIYEELGPRLIRLRQEQGLSQRDLAEALSVTRQAVSNWERGQTVPDLGMLSRIGEVLGVDWNQLCGGVKPRRRRLPGWTAALAAGLLLMGAVWGGARFFQRQEELRKEEPAPVPAAVQGYHPSSEAVRRSILINTMEPCAYGMRSRAVGILAEQLEEINETGDVPVTHELREAFALAGEACSFRFLPAYAGGEFEDRNAVMTWLYRGLSRGEGPTTAQVDVWLNAWFDPSVQWTHGSTEDYTLREDGWYWPESGYSGTCAYTVVSLERRTDSSFLAQLLLSGTGEARDGSDLEDRLLTLELTVEEGGQPCFSSIAWSRADI